MLDYGGEFGRLSLVASHREGNTQTREKEGKQMGEDKECVYCEGVADFVWLEGGWHVCAGCVKEGKTDTEAI